jgi:hypothetical protein
MRGVLDMSYPFGPRRPGLLTRLAAAIIRQTITAFGQNTDDADGPPHPRRESAAKTAFMQQNRDDV